MLSNNNRQKSLKRRFLLILGLTAFIAFCAFGLMVIFSDNIFKNVEKSQKVIFGLVIILYAFLRFPRLLKKSDDEI